MWGVRPSRVRPGAHGRGTQALGISKICQESPQVDPHQNQTEERLVSEILVMNPGLKPCPFCGTSRLYVVDNADLACCRSFVSCDCGARGAEAFGSTRVCMAHDLWNRRTPPALKPGPKRLYAWRGSYVVLDRDVPTDAKAVVDGANLEMLAAIVALQGRIPVFSLLPERRPVTAIDGITGPEAGPWVIEYPKPRRLYKIGTDYVTTPLPGAEEVPAGRDIGLVAAAHALAYGFRVRKGSPDGESTTELTPPIPVPLYIKYDHE